MSSNISENIETIVKNLNSSTIMLDKIKNLISKMIEYIKEYIKDTVGNLNITDTDMVFDKFEKILESYFTALFEKNIPDLEIIDDYKTKLDYEIDISNLKIEKNKKILSDVYQNYQKLEVKNMFNDFVLNDETKKMFDHSTMIIPYSEYIEKLTSVCIDKSKSFIQNIMVKTANKKRLEIFQKLNRDSQTNEDLSKNTLKKTKDLQIIKISEYINQNDDETIKLIIYSIIVYYQQMIYLKKIYDDFQIKKIQMTDERLKQEHEINIISSEIDSIKIEKDKNLIKASDAQKYAVNDYNTVKAILEEKNKVLEEKNKVLIEISINKRNLDDKLVVAEENHKQNISDIGMIPITDATKYINNASDNISNIKTEIQRNILKERALKNNIQSHNSGFSFDKQIDDARNNNNSVTQFFSELIKLAEQIDLLIESTNLRIKSVSSEVAKILLNLNRDSSLLAYQTAIILVTDASQSVISSVISVMESSELINLLVKVTEIIVSAKDLIISNTINFSVKENFKLVYSELTKAIIIINSAINIGIKTKKSELAVNDAKQTVQNVTKILDDATKEVNDAAKSVDDATKEVNNANKKLDDAYEAVNDAKEKLDDVKNIADYVKAIVDKKKVDIDVIKTQRLDMTTDVQKILQQIININEQMQDIDKKMQDIDENIQKIEGVTSDQIIDLTKKTKLIIGDIDIFRNCGIFPLPDDLSDVEQEYFNQYTPPSKIVIYLTSGEGVKTLFTFCEMHEIIGEKPIDFFKLHNFIISDEDIVTINRVTNYLSKEYKQNFDNKIKNKLFIAMLIKVCLSDNVTFTGLEENIDEIKSKLFNFQNELHNFVEKYLKNKRVQLTS